jgi:chromosome segregation ATPase
MADLERRVSTLEEHMARVVATLDTLATNQNRLDEALVTLAEAQIRTEERFNRNQEQFRETDARIANLTSAIGQLIVEMRSKAN